MCDVFVFFKKNTKRLPKILLTMRFNKQNIGNYTYDVKKSCSLYQFTTHVTRNQNAKNGGGLARTGPASARWREEASKSQDFIIRRPGMYATGENEMMPPLHVCMSTWIRQELS